MTSKVLLKGGFYCRPEGESSQRDLEESKQGEGSLNMASRMDRAMGGVKSERGLEKRKTRERAKSKHMECEAGEGMPIRWRH